MKRRVMQCCRKGSACGFTTGLLVVLTLAADGSAVAAPPGEVLDVIFMDTAALSWGPGPGAESYNVYRGELSDLGTGTPGRCHGFDISGTGFNSPADPLPDAGFFYLVTGETVSEGEGTPGADSLATTRTLLGSCRAVMRNHVAQRAGYGADEWTRDQISTLGLAGYLDSQLDPASISEADNTSLNNGLALWEPAANIFGLIGGQVVRSVYARRQTEQQYTAFWTNHFNTDWGKNSGLLTGLFPPCSEPPRPQCDPGFPARSWQLATDFHTREVQAFRDLGFNGNFREILERSALSPAMILFLDGFTNIAAAPNENYAREHLELSSMGVNGGYTQQDIENLARILSGWTICKKPLASLDDPLAACIVNYWEELPAGEWVATFRPAQHDCGQKIMFPGTNEQLIVPNTCASKPSGVADLTLALDAIAAHPSTARFISTKILERFVMEQPSEALIDILVETWNDPSNPHGVGDLREVLRTALTSSEFNDPDRVGGKIKTPLEHMASLLRSIRGTTDGIDRVANFLIGAQQIPFFNPVPTGYPEAGASWIDTSNTLERQNLGVHAALVNGPTFGSDPIGLLSANGVPTGPGHANEIVDFFSDLFFGGALTPAERQAAINFLNTNDQGTLSAYDQIRIRETVGFLLGFPQFQEQ